VNVLFKETALIRLLGLKIPVLLFLGPRVLRLDETGCTVKIPFDWRSKNHVGSMYFGALCAGADLASGLPAFRAMRAGHARVVPLFADVHGEFLKRADGDVHFDCEQGAEVAAAVERADRTGERITMPVHVTCTVPDRYGGEPVARFTLGLTMKRKA
jgi:acyl-coenzyme A thioesterase PaaI-like protein